MLTTRLRWFALTPCLLLVSGCGWSTEPTLPKGDLIVVTETEGVAPDPDGYLITATREQGRPRWAGDTLYRRPPRWARSEPIGPNDTVVLKDIPFVVGFILGETEPVYVWITDLAENCWVGQPPPADLQRSGPPYSPARPEYWTDVVFLREDQPVTYTFRIVCTESP